MRAVSAPLDLWLEVCEFPSHPFDFSSPLLARAPTWSSHLEATDVVAVDVVEPPPTTVAAGGLSRGSLEEGACAAAAGSGAPFANVFAGRSTFWVWKGLEPDARAAA